MQIVSHAKKYNVNIYNDFDFFYMLKKTYNSLWVIDRNVYEIYKDLLFKDISEEKLYVLEAVEDKKTIETALDICEVMTNIPAKRNATIISVGGGIVQDITGFASNILYRGVKWQFVPTTLLAACDSCIGGKTSLNYKKYKNLLGTFFAPDDIHICSAFFHSLSEKDFESGLGEVVKFNILSGEEGLEKLENSLGMLIAREPRSIDEFLLRSLTFKKRFIEEDEFDRGVRVHLNFAHTFGHAIEVITKYEIPHGTAVAIGTVMANRISYRRSYIDKTVVERSEKLLLKIININIDSLNRPLCDYIDAIRKDKKQIDDGITAVLITAFGEKSVLSLVHDVKSEEIEDAVKYFIDRYRDK